MQESRLTSRLNWRPARSLRALNVGAEGPVTGSAEELALDPPLSPLDEAIFLLHTVAEVEHSLLVQYLYAAFSMKPEYAGGAVKLRNTATEEMGHLITIQNLLLCLGGPLNFDREDFPFRSGLYPFPFALEPVTLGSIAKYVMAEKPGKVDAAIFPADLEAEIAKKAKLEAGMDVGRVGQLLNRLKLALDKLPDSAFAPDTDQLQATPDEWGASAEFQRDPGGNIVAVSRGVIVLTVANKKEALDAITAISLQGEGAPAHGAYDEPHFRRFLDLYKSIRDQPGPISFPVPANPSAAAESGTSAILFGPARKLAQLSNFRYRFLLSSIAHSLSVPRPDSGRSVLVGWCFTEMLLLVKKTALLLVQMPRQKATGRPVAAIPFELPYTMALPGRDKDRWRLLGTILDESAERIHAIRTDPDFAGLDEYLKNSISTFLDQVEAEDASRRSEIETRSK